MYAEYDFEKDIAGTSQLYTTGGLPNAILLIPPAHDKTTYSRLSPTALDFIG